MLDFRELDRSEVDEVKGKLHRKVAHYYRHFTCKREKMRSGGISGEVGHRNINH